MKDKIAILLDTGCTYDSSYFSENVFFVPLYINFKEKSYKDMEEITSRQVYEKMKTEIPKTSIASPGEIEQKIKKIIDKGYNKILSITISSGLSGIYSAISMVSEKIDDCEIKVVDTKNISFGTGMIGIYADMLIQQNPEIDFDDLYEKVIERIGKSKVFFTIETLEYLIAGGRIGKVLGGLGTLLKIKPVISCNKDGIYYTVKKVRSSEKALSEIISLAKEHIAGSKNYVLTLLYRDDKKLLEKMENELKNEIKNAMKYLPVDLVSPALGVHTGDSIIGVGALILDD